MLLSELEIGKIVKTLDDETCAAVAQKEAIEKEEVIAYCKAADAKAIKVWEYWYNALVYPFTCDILLEIMSKSLYISTSILNYQY